MAKNKTSELSEQEWLSLFYNQGYAAASISPRKTNQFGTAVPKYQAAFALGAADAKSKTPQKDIHEIAEEIERQFKAKST
jgi:hypothetical protein